ncbi:MAG: peroxidase family protein, partial [Limimaricola soesokkakensis]
MANYIKSDLDFILAQIKIAEAHTEAMKSGADPRTSLLQLIGNAPNLSFGLRTVDGSLNNLIAGQTDFGQADQAFPRLTTPYYLDEQDGDVMSFGPGGTITNTDYGTNGNVADADPRTISNLIVTQDVSNPAAIRAALKAAGVEGTAQTAATNAISAAYKATLNANGANAEVEAATAVVSGASADASAAVAALNAATALQLSYTAGVTMATGVPAAMSAAQTAAGNLITALNVIPGEPVPVPPFTLIEPVQADYVVTADFNTAHAQWVAAAPTDPEPLATDFPGVAAFETAHALWVEAQVAHAANEPDPADFPDSTTFDAAHAEWDAVAPTQPLSTDFPDVAAFETAYALWVDAQEAHAIAEPVTTDFPDVAAFDAAHDQWATAQAAHAAAETQYQTDLVAFNNATTAATDAFDAAMAAASSAVTAAGAVVTALGDNPTDGAQALEALANDLRTAIEGIEEGGFLPVDAATITSALDAFNGAPALAQSNIGELTTLRNNADVDRATAQVAADNATAALDAANDDLAIAQVAANTAGTPEETAAALQGLLDDFGLQTDENGGLVIENRAPDEGLSAPFNSWMTLFGQFFDHGLDLVTKGGNGTIYMPLQPDDPLYVEGSNTNFMALTRASIDTQNQTTPHVDQNQTYSSHPSHQVFLREWVPDGSGKPVETGKLITGSNGGMATWADVKAQARDILGIELDDADVLAVPALITDLYGNAEMGPNGFPQVVMADGTIMEGNPNNPVDATFAAKTGHAFLVDIAHNAVPGTVDHDRNPATPDIEITPDNDGIPNSVLIANGFGINEQYDNELLDAHFMAGDGRVNENIGLTAVHHIFHSEHNRLVDYSINQVIMPAMVNETGTPEEAAADLAFLNEWLRVKLPEGTDPATVDFSTLQWDGARLFQLAKFGTEMQYQHLVFEDFARKMQPQIDVFLAPVGYDTTIDPSILAEFAHTVYRFGHSMLTETIDRLDPSFNAVGTDWSTQDAEQIGLIEAFLNPIEYNKGGEIHADMAAGAVVRGMTRQVGNEIDEFVTDALRSNLLGLPLDLAAINLARGRDTAIPTLNMAREQFYTMTGDTQLKPYDSWFDFTLNIKNPASVVNFIAAYGTHATLDAAQTLAEKRDAAMKLVFGGEGAPLDRQAFLNATGSYASDKGGLDKVDFWIGGLAEAIAPFGGMLGSTFNFIFETQLEALQDGDRFYYLARTASMNFLAELENNSFASMIVENTDATHLPIDVFATPSYVLEVDQTKQYNHGMGSDDPFEASLFDPQVNKLVIRANENSLQFTGGDHVVLGGTEGNDTLIAGIGDDSIWGDGGNDRIEGGHGNDNIDGGAGDDIITDLGGDDVIKGNDGNDVIHGGPGENLIIGGRGSDFIITGEDFSEVFAGPGNDFILGTTTNEAPIGGEGDDWFEGGSQDGAMGDNSDAFGADTIAGHDVFFGRDGFNEFVAEGGDDIMVSSVGITRNEGMSGFDWVSYIGRSSVYADLNLPAFDETPIPPDENTALDRYEAVEGLSGSHGNDVLIGSEVDDLGVIPPAVPGGEEEGAPLEPAGNGQQGSILTAAGIARIDGLQELLGAGVNEFRSGNIILGGGGSDRIEGLGGDDIIDGDSYLNVRIARQGTNETWTTMVGDLQKRMLAGEINPSELYIVREILDGGKPGDIDTAVYAGQAIDYQVFTNAAGGLTVLDMNPDDGDTGSDQLYNIERIEFSDQTMIIQGDPPVPVDVVLSIADAPTRIETGDTGSTNLAFGLSLDDTSFSGSLRVGFNVGAVTGQAQIVNFVDGLGTLTVPVVNDNVPNGTDTRVVTLTGATGIGATVTLGTATASGMVTEDDVTAILLSIADAPMQVETGDTGTTNLAFGLNLNDTGFNGDLQVGFDTSTATGQSQTVTFTGGIGTLTVQVPNDDLANGTEMMAVTLTGATGTGTTVALGTTTASGMVTEDDGTAIVLSITDAPMLVETGDTGATNLTFGMSVDDTTFTGTLQVNFDTSTATGQTQAVSFVNGVGTLIVPVDNDDVDDGAEMVGVTLTGATGTGVVATLGTATANGMVTEDDVIPVILSIANAPTVAEAGDTGTTDLAFGLSLDNTGFTGNLTVSFSVGAAAAQTQIVSFTGGLGTLTVPVANDDVDDGDEMVEVTLTGATGAGVAATLGTATASGMVTEDDVAPPPVDVLLSIANAPTLAEAGDTGTTDLAFGLSLDDTSFTGTLQVTYNAGSATNQTQAVSFAAGIGTLTVQVANDDVDDGDETVPVTLTGATGTGVAVTLGTASASGTVTEDDVAAPPDPGSVLPIDFNASPLLSYSGQDQTPQGFQIDQ